MPNSFLPEALLCCAHKRTSFPRRVNESRPPIRHHSCIPQPSCLLNPKRAVAALPRPQRNSVLQLAGRAARERWVPRRREGPGTGPEVHSAGGGTRGDAAGTGSAPPRAPGLRRRDSPAEVGRGLRRAPLVRPRSRTPATA